MSRIVSGLAGLALLAIPNISFSVTSSFTKIADFAIKNGHSANFLCTNGIESYQSTIYRVDVENKKAKYGIRYMNRNESCGQPDAVHVLVSELDNPNPIGRPKRFTLKENEDNARYEDDVKSLISLMR